MSSPLRSQGQAQAPSKVNYAVDRTDFESTSAPAGAKDVVPSQGWIFTLPLHPSTTGSYKLWDEATAKAWPAPPLGRIRAFAFAGLSPRRMGLGPVFAIAKALEKAQLTIPDIERFEINEAFAAQVLACTRELGFADDSPLVNPNGGAIAFGHPLGHVHGHA